MPVQLDDILYLERSGISGNESVLSLIKKIPIIHQVGGQFLLDPNEINGWGVLGWIDNSNTQDLGNVGAANLTRIIGGLVFPFDVRIKRFFAKHYNSNGGALPWGWVVGRQRKNTPGNTTTTTFMLDESFDRGAGQFGLRDYGNNQNQESDITSFVDDIIPSGEVIFLGVGAPTANTTNQFVRILAGYLEFERV